MTMQDVRNQRIGEFIGDVILVHNGGNGWSGNGPYTLYVGNGNPIPIQISESGVAILGNLTVAGQIDGNLDILANVIPPAATDGTGAVGTSASIARGDHQHPLQAVGGAGTYNQVVTDAFGRVISGTTQPYLTGNQTITVTGDVSGTGTTAITATLATVNSNVGAFGSATVVPIPTVNGKGLVTGVATATITPAWSSIASKPTTLSGFGITDALPLSGGTVAGSLTVTGNLTVNGGTTTVNSTTVTTADNIIVLNNGEVGAGVTAGSAGIQVDRGSLTAYQFVFRESDDLFCVGTAGGLQAVATRQDSPTNGYYGRWNSSSTRIDHVSPATVLSDIGAAPLASPALTGTPTAPSASTATNTTQIATTAFVQAVAALLAPLAGATFSGYVRGNTVALTDAATITPDMAAGNRFSVTLGGSRTLANPSNLTAGQSGCIIIRQDGTGSRTLSYGSYWKFQGGTAPTLSTTAGRVDRLQYDVVSATEIHATLLKDFR